MRAVNLLPRQEVVENAEKSSNTVGLVAAIGGGVVVLMLTIGFLLASHSVDHQRAALASAKAQLAAVPVSHASASANASRASLLSDRERRALALATALGKRVSWDRVLRRLALVLPQDVWLTDLSGTTPVVSPTTAAPTTTTPASSLPAVPTALTIQGYTYSQAGVARLLSRLQVLPDLTNVQLQTSKVAKVGGQNVIQFTVLSDLNTGGDAA